MLEIRFVWFLLNRLEETRLPLVSFWNNQLFVLCNRRRTSKLLHRSTAKTQSSARVRVTSSKQSSCCFVNKPEKILIISFIYYLCTAAGSLQSPAAAVLSPSQSVSAPVVNGVQPAAHQNGVSADFEEIIQLNNSGGSPAQTQSGLVGEPILAFEGGEPFMMKTGPMKPQHVAGTVKRHQVTLW